ncbi:MAG: magnesium transporter, partial [Planctomycetota bacterium]
MQNRLLPAGEERTHWIAACNGHEIAAALNHAPTGDRVQIFGMLSAAVARQVFDLLEPMNQHDILEAVDEEQRLRLLHDMAPDDRARLAGQLDRRERERLLDDLAPEERQTTQDLLRYPPFSAGRIMSPHVLQLQAEMTVADALAAIRSDEARAETIYYLPVVDPDMRFIGGVDLATLVRSDAERRIVELSSREVPAVTATEDQEDVARLMKEADLLAVPVVDQDQRLVGIITFDDAMEVLEFEEGEDLARAGAAEPVGRPYLSVSILRLMRSRIVWLSVLGIAAILTVNVLSIFEQTLEEIVSLALFIPLLIGIGGNTGAQSATTILR